MTGCGARAGMRSSRRAVPAALSLSVVILLSCLGIPTHEGRAEHSRVAEVLSGAFHWRFSIVDSEGDVGSTCSLALDQADRAHISYYDGSNGDLKYATNKDGEWACYTIDGEGDVGRYSSVAVDPAGFIHISYLDWTNRDLKYATNVGGAWSTQTVDSEGSVGLFSSIAVDDQGAVHISYLDWTDYDLKYATNKDGDWAIYTVDSEGEVGFDTSLALDPDGWVHISYGDWTNEDLKYATNAGGTWVCHTIDSEGYVGYDTSIAVDAMGRVHISYHDESNATLKYATNVGGFWASYKIDGDGNVGLSTSISVDPQGKIHITYSDFTDISDRDLKYATNVNGAWESYTLDSEGDLGFDTSVAVASNGLVHIGYSDFTDHDLRYAYGTAMNVGRLAVSVGAIAVPTQSKLTVRFSSNVTGGVQPYTYDWDFGDGNASTAAAPVHTYATAGEYTVRLSVTDSLGSTATALTRITLSNGTVIVAPEEEDLLSRLMDFAPLLIAILVVAVIAALIVWGTHARRPRKIEVRAYAQEPSARSTHQPAPALTRPEEMLFQLRKMRDQGLITEEEYEARTSEILKRW